MIGRTFLLEQMSDAHRYVETGHKAGSAVVIIRLFIQRCRARFQLTGTHISQRWSFTILALYRSRMGREASG